MRTSYLYILSQFLKHPTLQVALRKIDQRLADASIRLLQDYQQGQIAEDYARRRLYHYFSRALPQIINKQPALLNHYDAHIETSPYNNLLKFTYDLYRAQQQGQLTQQEVYAQKVVLFNLVDLSALTQKLRLQPQPNFNDELALAYVNLYNSYQTGKINQQQAQTQLNFLMNFADLQPQQKRQVEQHLLTRLPPVEQHRLELAMLNANNIGILGNRSIFNDPMYAGGVHTIWQHAHHNYAGVPLRHNWHNHFGQPMNNLELLSERRANRQLGASTRNPQPFEREPRAAPSLTR